MAKWVALVLLVLAVMVFGMSRLRPVPPVDEATATPAVTEQTPTESGPEASPTVAMTVAAPPARLVREPKFGVPGQTSTPEPTATPDTDGKEDPFSKVATAQPITGTIKAMVFSTSVDGPRLTKFAANTESIYVTATPEGLKDTQELVASYRSIAKDNEPLSPPTVSSGPPRRRVYRLTPPADGWKPGPYQIVLRAPGNDTVVGLDRFEIVAELSHQELPAPEYLDLVPDLGADTPTQSTFNSTDKEIILRVAAPELKPGTPIRTIWSVVEVDRLTAGELVALEMQPAPGEGMDAFFKLEPPPGGYHVGSYNVEVYFDQELAGSQAFFVQKPARTTSDR